MKGFVSATRENSAADVRAAVSGGINEGMAIPNPLMGLAKWWTTKVTIMKATRIFRYARVRFCSSAGTE